MNEKEENELNTINEIIALLKQYRDFYIAIIEEIFGKEILLEENTHQEFASLIIHLFNNLFDKQFKVKETIDLTEAVLEFGKRLKIHRFTKKQLDDFSLIDELKIKQSKVIDHYENIDKITNKQPESIEEYRLKLRELKEEWEKDPLPAEWTEYKDEIETRLVSSIELKEYFIDLSTKLSQTYETFILFSTLILILIRKLNSHDSKFLEKSLRKGEKLKRSQLYHNKRKKDKDNPLLKDYLSNKPFFLKILKIYEWVYSKKGINKIRNLVIHHLDEKGKCELIDDYVLIYFNSKEPEKFSYEQISNINHQLQMLNFIIYYITLSYHYHAYAIVLELSLNNIKDEDNKA